MNPADALKTKLNTDYPIDQVIFRSDIIPVAIGAGGFNDISIPNPLGVPFLPIGQFSLTSDFSGVIYDENAGPWSGGFEQYSTSVFVQPDGSSIDIRTNNNTGGAVTLYFRIIGLALPGDTTEYPFTSGYKSLIFNTDDNYMKLYLSGKQTIASTANYQINHNLGYKPRSLFWTEDSFFGIGMATYVDANYIALADAVIPVIGNNTITITNGTFGALDVYYRVYIED